MFFPYLFLPFFASAAIAGPSPAASDTLAPPDSCIQPGEELTYNVSYASVDIGQVRIRLLGAFKKNNRRYFRAEAYIDSYRGVPLVNLHAVYDAVMDQDFYSVGFEARHKDSGQWQWEEYRFRYPDSLLVVDQGIWKSSRITRRDTIRIDSLCQDGLSILYLARHELFSHRQMSIPTVVNRKKGRTIIDFTGERTKDDIDAVDYPVDLIHFRGEAGFVGIFGLTGGFEGWFSNDAARIPVIAKMKVLIGNVRIELIKWTRAGWAPPRAVGEDSR